MDAVKSHGYPSRGGRKIATIELPSSQRAAARDRLLAKIERLTLLAALLGAGGCSGPGDGGGDAPPKAPDGAQDTASFRDDDEDGYSVEVDCDDHDPQTHPDAADDCNGEDDDCDGVVDDAAPGEATECVVQPDGWFIQERSAWHDDGSTLSANGDLDRDGLPDLLLGGPGDGGNGTMHVFLNAEIHRGEVSTSVARWTLYGARGDELGMTTASSTGSADFYPDLDGDGSDDLLIGAPGWGAGALYLVTAASLEFEYGDLSIGDVAAWRLEDPAGASEQLALDVVTLGDVDGDALPDVWLASQTDAWLLPGAQLLDPAPTLASALRFPQPDDAEEYFFGGAVKRVGDLDGDGLDEIAIPCTFCGDAGGYVSIFLGTSVADAIGDGVPPGPADILVAAHGGGEIFASDVAGHSDVDADGLDDWAMCDGQVWLFYHTGESVGETVGTDDADAIVDRDGTTPWLNVIAFGELDGDPGADLAAESTWEELGYFVYAGSLLRAGGVIDASARTRSFVFGEEDLGGGGFGVMDWDGDGADDLLTGQPFWSPDGDRQGSGGAVWIPG